MSEYKERPIDIATKAVAAAIGEYMHSMYMETGKVIRIKEAIISVCCVDKDTRINETLVNNVYDYIISKAANIL